KPLHPAVAHSFGGASSEESGRRLGMQHVGALDVSPTGPADEQDAERLAVTLAAGAGAALPGFDFASVRIHSDDAAAASARALRARAYAVGTHIVFGKDQYRPERPAGRHLLAHELAHVARAGSDPLQTLHRYEAPEHQDFGDVGLEELATFLQTKEGAAFGSKLSSATAATALQSDPFLRGKRFTVQGVELTVGDIIAMAGDFYATPVELANADPDELKEIRDAIREEREGKLKGGRANERYQQITQKYICLGKRSKEHSFIGLASVNAPHFTPTNRDAWKSLHTQALQAARVAGKDQRKLDMALLTDTFGGHFLTDAFASGHLFDKRRLETEID